MMANLILELRKDQRKGKKGEVEGGMEGERETFDAKFPRRCRAGKDVHQ